ncbi:Mismatch repair endonuclease pms2 [Cichlidogyrus casuarinus]|uniref:Mismatch repair endonuclease pms2 n=1 Tax=Cichlidogyrus casuarinus TaxID=1844966 RepID=A0ABD2Q0M3_9PLAT
MGRECIEVIDNGDGIRQSDFPNLCQPHSTSKIHNFDDLSQLMTFGFRGEALSSLCLLSDVTIHTRSADSSTGYKLVFNNLGRLDSQSPLARGQGTTISLNNLFHTVPVRHKILSDSSSGHVSKEFSHALFMITSYCIALADVQIACYKADPKQSLFKLIISNGQSKTVQQNIINIFGPTIKEELLALDECSQISPDVIEEFQLESEEISKEIVHISGFISKPNTGDATKFGRSSSDRQFVFVNSRPCDMPKVNKLVTTLWRRCARESLLEINCQMPQRSLSNKFPFLAIFINLAKDAFDVNVCPDKRRLLFHHENLILAHTKTAVSSTLSRVCGSQQPRHSIDDQSFIQPVTEETIQTYSPVAAQQRLATSDA